MKQDDDFGQETIIESYKTHQISRAPFEVASKFAMIFTFTEPSLRQSQTPPLHFIKIGGSDTTGTLLKHYIMSNLGQD